MLYAWSIVHCVGVCTESNSNILKGYSSRSFLERGVSLYLDVYEFKPIVLVLNKINSVCIIFA